MSTKSFGEKIKELRSEMHLTQAQLADMMGCKKSMISYYEQQESESSVSLDAIIKFSKALNVTTDYLLGQQPLTLSFDVSGLTEKSKELLENTYEMLKSRSIEKNSQNDKTQESPEPKENFDDGYALEKYEDYKYRWEKAHISDEVMCSTQSAYENDPEADGMTFREYVEEFGYADGSCYAGFEEFVQNEFPLYALAEDIEQAMYERGEYDAPESDRLSWIGSDAPVDAVLSSLENAPASLVEYFRKELAVISPDDEWAGKAKECISKIQTLCDVEELKTQPEQNGLDTKKHNQKSASPKKSGSLDEH